MGGPNGRLCLVLCTGGDRATESQSSEAEPGANGEPLWPLRVQSSRAPGSGAALCSQAGGNLTVLWIGSSQLLRFAPQDGNRVYKYTVLSLLWDLYKAPLFLHLIYLF